MLWVVLQIILIVAVGWVALSVLVLPLVMLIGRAGYRADAEALRQHRDMLAAEQQSASTRAQLPAHAFRA